MCGNRGTLRASKYEGLPTTRKTLIFNGLQGRKNDVETVVTENVNNYMWIKIIYMG